jgi:mannan endo-1,4-beta-mannosidase
MPSRASQSPRWGRPPGESGASSRNAAPNRREVLRGAAALAAGGLLVEACGHAGPGAAMAGTPGGVAVPPAANRPMLPGSLEVRGPRFYRDGKPFFVSGFNYWAAPTLARDGNTAGWDQLRRDLDALQGLGVNMLRIMAATEGPDTEPLRIVPSLQPELGKYDPAGVNGLLKLIAELEKRKLLAVLTLNNFWHWSGGFAQYLTWAGKGPIPYPPPQPHGSWDQFQHFCGQFYTVDKATKGFSDLLAFLVPQLKNSPVVIWQLCNEPRGMNNVRAFDHWIDDTAGFIRSLAPGQLITTGSEGLTATPSYAGLDVVRDHKSSNIDYVTVHMWAENWGWVHGENLAHGYPKAVELAKKYINTHAGLAAKLDKPIVLEEFGFPRDGGSFVPGSPTTLRDQYFDMVYGMVHSLLPTSPFAGLMPWAWAGDTLPPRPGEYWKPGDPFVGDPPHEQQGWYSVYGSDTTVKLIKDWTARITAASAPSPAA